MMARPVSRRALARSFSPFSAQPLELVRGRARFEGAAAQNGRAGLLHRVGRSHQLGLILHRTRPRHDLEFLPADGNVADRNDGIVLLPFAADQFVTFLHRHDLLDLGPGSEGFQRLVGAFVADGADDDSFDAPHDMGTIAEFADLFEYGGFVLFRDIRF